MKPYIILIVAAVALAACATTPQELCDKLADLHARPSKCVSRLELQKAEEPDVYKRTALCIKGASTQADGAKCIGE